jgi:SpoVK/Ycf46/Vps4 family AAA+-type ATPase
VLLFDEADALFGKRTDVKDSHDRHANVEVSYLLQRIEAYQGLAILTTNLEKAIDQAFLRRFSFSVSFPFPKADLREAIWRRIFPAETPTEGLKYDKLASLNISGGNIRSIALNAAFMAAAAGEPMTMAHLLKATQQEFIKLGLTLTSAETSGWLSKPRSTQGQPVSQWRRGQ